MKDSMEPLKLNWKKVDRVSEILISAMRQYRHNDSDEFVAGYDKPIIDKQFKTMQDRIEELEEQLLFLVNNDSINDSLIDQEVLMMLAPNK